MEKIKINPRLGILVLIVLVAAMARLLPHPPNVSPVGAMALFGGAFFMRKWQSLLLPLLALWLSDLVLNNVVYKAYNPDFVWISRYMLWVYAAVGLTVVMSWTLLKNVQTKTVMSTSVICSILFFLITNFGSWFTDTLNLYPDNFSGLMASYAAGIPFFINSLLGDLMWCGVLFGGYAWVKKQYPALAV